MAAGTLTSTTIANTYMSLLKVKGGANQLLDGTPRLLEDGDGNDSVLAISTDSVLISGSGTKLDFSTDGSGEYLSGDGTDLTLGSGADINLTATADVNIPVNVGLRFGDGGENIETDNTDLTITSGGDIILTVGAAGSVYSTGDGGTSNTLYGKNAGNSIISGGNYNVVVGDEAGTAISTGDQNVALGYQSLMTEDTGGRNTAVGAYTLNVLNNDAQSYNTAMGYAAGLSVSTGVNNTIIGGLAGDGMQTADNCVAIGQNSLSAVATQDGTVAIGKDSLAVLTTGDGNTAVGYQALQASTDGTNNTAIGYQALYQLPAGGLYNTAVGYGALSAANHADADRNTAVGRAAGDAITSGYENTMIGSETDPSAATGVNQTIIGSSTTGVADNSVTLGNASVTDVYMASDSGAAVHAGAITGSGILSVDDTTDSSSTVTGSIHTDGGLGVAKKSFFGDDMDLGSKYVVNEQGRSDHVANTMPSPYYRFDGVDDIITVTDNAVMDDIFSSGGSIRALVYINSDGEDSSGNIVGKYGTGNAGYWVSTNNESAGFVAIRLYRYFDGTDINATTSTLVPINAWSEIVVTYDDSLTTNDPIFYMNGAVLASTSTTPSGTAETDNGENFLIGRNEGGDRAFDGEISRIEQYNKILTATEVKELYSGASVPFKYKGANQTDMNSATLVSNVSLPYTTFENASATGFDVENDGTSGYHIAGTTDAISFVKGKSYRVSFTWTKTTANATLAISKADNNGLTNLQAITSIAAASSTGDYTGEFVSNSTITGVIAFYHNSATVENYTISNFSLVPIGAVAEYDGSSATAATWFDKSGNDLDGTVTGASLENKVDTIQVSGITFPATDHASANANTLDDYEEGTWTPTNANTPTSASGSYVKIGSTVMCQYQFTANATMTGDMGGLPFTVGSAQHGAGIVGYQNTSTAVWSVTYDAGTTVFSFRIGASQLHVEAGKTMRGSVTYKV